MTEILRIQTRYAGRHFRSRLEARWAVFFDAMGIKWEYEPQGYVIDGRPYLPDFLLSDCGTWVEVKGAEETLDRNLMAAAAAQLPQMPCKYERGPQLMILGTHPEPVNVGDWGWVSFDSDGLTWDHGFSLYRKNLRPWALLNAQRDHAGSWLDASFDAYEPGLPEAYTAALSARFEHGERGAS